MRLLEISRLWAHPCTKMPPPPWELLVTAKPSMRDGLHWKLLGNGLCAVEVFKPQPLGLLAVVCVPLSRSVVPAGNPAGSKPSVHGSNPSGTRTPFESTVIPAPSYAPRRVGSCSCSARLPLNPASQPTVASSGKRSTCGLEAVGVKAFQPLPQPGSYPAGTPVGANPNRQTARRRQSFRMPAGCVFASMMLEAAPTPCSRTGFHINNNSWWLPGG